MEQFHNTTENSLAESSEEPEHSVQDRILPPFSHFQADSQLHAVQGAPYHLCGKQYHQNDQIDHTLVHTDPSKSQVQTGKSSNSNDRCIHIQMDLMDRTGGNTLPAILMSGTAQQEDKA